MPLFAKKTKDRAFSLVNPLRGNTYLQILAKTIFYQCLLIFLFRRSIKEWFFPVNFKLVNTKSALGALESQSWLGFYSRFLLTCQILKIIKNIFEKKIWILPWFEFGCWRLVRWAVLAIFISFLLHT